MDLFDGDAGVVIDVIAGIEVNRFGATDNVTDFAISAANAAALETGAAFDARTLADSAAWAEVPTAAIPTVRSAAIDARTARRVNHERVTVDNLPASR